MASREVQSLEAAIRDVETPQSMLVNVGDTMSKLRDGIAWIDTEIRRQVTDGREDLLSQVRVLHAMETQLVSVKSGAENLASMVTRINEEMATPYSQMNQCVTQLDRLYSTSALLRDVQHFLWLCKKLRSHMDAAAEDDEAVELERAAACVFDIDRLRAERQAEFSRIPVLHAKIIWAADIGAKVRSRAHSLLFRAVAERKQTKTANTLQAFHNLGVDALISAVDSVTAQITDTARDRVVSAIDPGVLSTEMKAIAAQAEGKGTSQRGGTAAANLKVVSLVGSVLDKTLLSCGDLLHVRTVLEKKHDPRTGHSLAKHLAEVDEATQVCDFGVFWGFLSGVMTKQLAVAFKSETVKNAFVAEYPQLLGLFKDFLRQLQNHSIALKTADTLEPLEPILSKMDEQKFLGSLASMRQPFKEAFANRCSAVLKRCFSGSPGYPSDSDVASLCKMVDSELARVLGDETLLRLTIDTAVEAVDEMSTRLQKEIITGPDAYQLSGHINNSQMKNAQLFNGMCTLHWHVAHTFRKRAEQAAAGDTSSHGESACAVNVKVLTDLEASVEASIVAAVAPLFILMRSSLEAKIFGIHKQTFSEQSYSSANGDAGEPSMPCSKYMSEFASQFTTVTKLLGFYDGSAAIFRQQAVQLVERLVDYTTRHISLLGTYRKVLPKAQRDVLHGDMARFEHTLAQLCPLNRPESAPARTALHGFRQLLFCNSLADIAESAEKLGCVSLCTAVDYSFSIAMISEASPGLAVIPHPYTVRGEDLATYSERLDKLGQTKMWEQTKSYLERHLAKSKSPISAKILQIGNTLEDATGDS